MKLLIYLVIAMWVIVGVLFVLFATKYRIVKAICITDPEEKSTEKANEVLSYFSYVYDFGRGWSEHLGMLSSTTRTKVGKSYQILITKDFNERVILLFDLLKFVIGLLAVSILLFALYYSGISLF